jgi:tetratricopeptide (TPR) repeat protein
MALGHAQEAERLLEQTMQTQRELGDRRGEGTALGALAGVYHWTGRADQAIETYVQALAIHRETGNQRFEGIVLGNLALAYQESGRNDLAEQTYEMALALHRGTGNRAFEGVAVGNLALVHQARGETGKALRFLTHALAIAREVGDRRYEGIVLGNLAGLKSDEESEALYLQALAIHADVGNPIHEGAHLTDYALWLVARRRSVEAAEAWRRGAALLRELGDIDEVNRKLPVMREACAKAGRAPFE